MQWKVIKWTVLPSTACSQIRFNIKSSNPKDPQTEKKLDLPNRKFTTFKNTFYF